MELNYVTVSVILSIHRHKNNRINTVRKTNKSWPI